MYRLFQRRKTLALVGAWFVVVALTADAMNLDDLCPGVYVVHDDADAVDASAGLSASMTGPCAHVPGPSKVRQNASLPGKNPAVRIVFDEDSPSEAAQTFESSFFTENFKPDAQTIAPEDALPGTSLLLLHCTLII